MIPRTPYRGEAGKHQYKNTTWWMYLVSAYTGLSFLQVGQLDYITFLQWRRDAYIHSLEQTESGRDYLENAWLMEQVKPDRAALRDQFGKE